MESWGITHIWHLAAGGVSYSEMGELSSTWEGQLKATMNQSFLQQLGLGAFHTGVEASHLWYLLSKHERAESFMGLSWDLTINYNGFFGTKHLNILELPAAPRRLLHRLRKLCAGSAYVFCALSQVCFMSRREGVAQASRRRIQYSYVTRKR